MNKPEYCIAELRHLTDIYAAGCVPLADEVLNLAEFATWSACCYSQGHHYGDGGLCRHTFEVVRLCMEAAYDSNSFGNSIANEKVLLFSALFHDVGKIWDYKKKVFVDGVEQNLPEGQGGGFGGPNTEFRWIGTDHRRQIHHISRSAIFWSKAVEKTGLCKDIEDRVLHCILSHHGLREYGSPVAPFTREAWILHLCDQMSARTNDCDRLDMIKLEK